ncbi:unnamed protein product, partial [Mesorhabditis spiculigera]
MVNAVGLALIHFSKGKVEYETIEITLRCYTVDKIGPNIESLMAMEDNSSLLKTGSTDASSSFWERAQLFSTILTHLVVFCCLAMLDDFSTWNTLLITWIGLGIYPFQIRRMLVDCQDLNTITAWVYPGFVIGQIVAETIVFILFIVELGTRGEEIIFSFQKQGLVLIINLIGKAGIVNAIGLVTIHFSKEAGGYEKLETAKSVSTISDAEAGKSKPLVEEICCKIKM